MWPGEGSPVGKEVPATGPLAMGRGGWGGEGFPWSLCLPQSLQMEHRPLPGLGV